LVGTVAVAPFGAFEAVVTLSLRANMITAPRKRNASRPPMAQTAKLVSSGTGCGGIGMVFLRCLMRRLRKRPLCATNGKVNVRFQIGFIRDLYRNGTERRWSRCIHPFRAGRLIPVRLLTTNLSRLRRSAPLKRGEQSVIVSTTARAGLFLCFKGITLSAAPTSKAIRTNRPPQLAAALGLNVTHVPYRGPWQRKYRNDFNG
jgi:hypothetical protein